MCLCVQHDAEASEVVHLLGLASLSILSWGFSEKLGVAQGSLLREAEIEVQSRRRTRSVRESRGFLGKSVDDREPFRELAGLASKRWTVQQMLKWLDELRKEND